MANILLVEDDPNLSMVLQDYLEMLDYNVILAKDGEEGIKAFRQKNAFAIIMFSIGTVLHKQERFTKAVTAYQKAIALKHPDKEMIEQRIKLVTPEIP